MQNFTQPRRRMFAEFLLEDYRFYQQEMNQDDPEISKAIRIIQEAIGAAYCALTKNNPEKQAEWEALTGTDLPSVDVQQMEAPASVFQSLSRLSAHLHPDAAIRIVGYKDQLYKIFQRRGKDFKMIGTLSNEE